MRELRKISDSENLYFRPITPKLSDLELISLIVLAKYKLHAVCSVSGVFQSFDLSPAYVHDIQYLKDIKSQLSDCVLLGDKGFK